MSAITAYWHALAHLPATQVVLEEGSGLNLGRDWTIVIVNARLTIALIPVALVFLLASKLARWLVLALAIGKLVMLPTNLAALAPGEMLAFSWMIGQVLSPMGAAMLLVPSASAWFDSQRRSLADEFA